MILAQAQSAHPGNALALFCDMIADGGPSMTFPFVLKACSAVGVMKEGRKVHGMVCKLEMQSDAFVQNALINFYVKNCCHDDVFKVFDRMP